MSLVPSLLDRRLNRRTLMAALAAAGASAAIPAAKAAQDDRIELRVLVQPGWGPTDEPLQRTGKQSTLYTKLIPRFRETHPNVELTVETELGGTEGRTKYLLECRQGSQGDVMQLDGFWVPEFAAIGCTQPLDELLPQELIADYFEPFIVRYKGAIHGLIPGTAFNSMLWYRQDWLEEAGFSAPPKDWTELATYAEKLTQGDRYGLAFPGAKSEVTSVINLSLYWQEQDVFVTPENRPAFNNQTSIDIFNLLGDIYKAEWAPQEAVNMLYEDVEKLFYAEKAAMILHGSFIGPAVRQQPIADRVGLAPNPVSPRTQKRGTNAGGWGMSITTADEAKLPAAADFMTMFSGGDEELMLGILADVGYLPVQKSMAEHPQFQQTEWDKTILSELPYAKTRPAVEIYPDASLEWTTAFQEVMTGQKDAAAALADAEERTLKTAEDKGYLAG